MKQTASVIVDACRTFIDSLRSCKTVSLYNLHIEDTLREMHSMLMAMDVNGVAEAGYAAADLEDIIIELGIAKAEVAAYKEYSPEEPSYQDLAEEYADSFFCFEEETTVVASPVYPTWSDIDDLPF